MIGECVDDGEYGLDIGEEQSAIAIDDRDLYNPCRFYSSHNDRSTFSCIDQILAQSLNTLLIMAAHATKRIFQINDQI